MNKTITCDSNTEVWSLRLKRSILVLYWLLRRRLFSGGSRRAVSWCSWPAGVWHLYELGRDTLPHLWPETLPLPGQLHVPAGLVHWRDMGRVYEHRVWSCGTLPEGTDTHSPWVHLHTHLFYMSIKVNVNSKWIIFSFLILVSGFIVHRLFITKTVVF